MSRYADDLKRIVGVDLINKKLADLINKQPLEARRGEAYYSSTGDLVSGAANAASSASPSSNATLGSSNTTAAATSAAGTVLSGNRLTGGTNQAATSAGDLVSGMSNSFFRADDGVLDFNDLITAANGGDKTGLPGFTTSNSVVLGLNGMTDCTSGKAMSLRFDGNYVPPSTWSDANTPPVDPTWSSGNIWYWSDTPINKSATNFTDLMSSVQLEYLTNPLTLEYLCCFPDGYNPSTSTGGDNFANAIDIEQNKTIYGLRTGATLPGSVSHIWFYNALPYDTAACPTGYDYDSMCGASTSVVYPVKWPTADSFQLSLGDKGIMQPNQYDKNTPPNFENGVSTVNFCYGSGQYGTVEPATQGGWMAYQASTPGGAPTGIITVFNGDGTIRGFSDTRSPYKLNT